MNLFPRISFSLPKSLLAASIACLGLAPQTEAGVTWVATDVTGGLELTTVGALNITGSTGTLVTTPASTLAYVGTGVLEPMFVLTGDYRGISGGVWGSQTGADVWVGGGGYLYASSFSGNSFGYDGSNVVWDADDGASPGFISPSTTMFFSGLSVSSAFDGALDSGAVILWRHNGSGDTISISLTAPVDVPEPSSTALFGLGGIALLFRRRR